MSISFLLMTAKSVFSTLLVNRWVVLWVYYLPVGILLHSNELIGVGLDAQQQALRDNASLLVMLLNSRSVDQRQATVDEVVATGRLAGVEIVANDGSVRLRSRANLSADDAAKLDQLFA